MPKIMIVEDEIAVRDATAKLLAEHHYQPLMLQDFAQASAQILAAHPDLILLDINIPQINGQQLLRDLRAQSDIPIIMVTSVSSETDEALAISYGADDFIAKPYNPNILLLRIGAVLRRTHADSTTHSSQTYRDLKLDLARGTLASPTQTITLTKTELLIFSHLLSRHNQIVTRDELMTLLWHNSSFLNDNTLTVNISRLRDKLAKLGAKNAITTRKGLGYILS